MLVVKTIALLTFSPLILSGGGSTGCRSHLTSNSPAERPAASIVEKSTPSGDLRVLGEGQHSAVTKAFVAVVRDVESYAALTKLDSNLPKVATDFFETNALIAAFLGERNTGGYAIEISQSRSGISVSERRPPKDAMVTQVITSPFKVVSIDGGVGSPVWLALGDSWQQRVQSHSITTGRFAMSGGIVGTSEGFDLKGSVGVIREGRVATFQFHLEGAGRTRSYALTDYATGVVEGDKIKINRFSAGTLIIPPNTGLKADGRFSDGNRKLVLNLWSRPSMIADGYGGRGNLEAALAGK